MADRMNEGRFKSTYSRPEQRREGEELYSRMHSGQNPGMRDNPVVNNQERRSAPEQSARQQVPAPDRRNSSPANVQRREPSKPSSQPVRVQRTEPSGPSGQPATRVSTPAPDSRRTGSTVKAAPQDRTVSERSSTGREPSKVYASRR
ncbi:MAG: hypothetical protein A2V46_16140 [Bacteroidetes bacterium RBG_19FT_COMBO_42_7]|nr:MAG: hypothetical protein A2V46_16140 [Bacteroidetes bacterium RBG_19FT_COMBO_42_7]